MHKHRSIFALAILALIAGAPHAIAQPDTSHGDPKLQAKAKITFEVARVVALKAQAGTIKEWELEVEPGGSGLRYSFDIEANGKIHEVGVDAADGKLLENAVETDEDEAKEADEN